MPTTHELLHQLLALPDAKRKLALERHREHHPEDAEKLAQYLAANQGRLVEALGYEHWLRKLGAQTFTRNFAPIHREFWEWNWDCLVRIQENLPLNPADLVAFLPWSRE